MNIREMRRRIRGGGGGGSPEDRGDDPAVHISTSTFHGTRLHHVADDPVLVEVAPSPQRPDVLLERDPHTRHLPTGARHLPALDIVNLVRELFWEPCLAVGRPYHWWWQALHRARGKNVPRTRRVRLVRGWDEACPISTGGGGGGGGRTCERFHNGSKTRLEKRSVMSDCAPGPARGYAHK
jgi:hypothetical protein